MVHSQIRAGAYAVFRGCEYAASFSFYDEWVSLSTVDQQEEAPGAGWNRGHDGRWDMTARRSDLDRLFATSTMALWKGRYAVHITAVRAEIAHFEWNPDEVAVGERLGLAGRGPSPEHERVHVSPEGIMAGQDVLSEFSEVRQLEHDYPLTPPPNVPSHETHKKPKRGRHPKLGH